MSTKANSNRGEGFYAKRIGPQQIYKTGLLLSSCTLPNRLKEEVFLNAQKEFAIGLHCLMRIAICAVSIFRVIELTVSSRRDGASKLATKVIAVLEGEKPVPQL